MKLFWKIYNIITWVLVIIVLLLAVFATGTRALGYKPYRIKSASMTPNYCVNDLVFVKHIPPEQVKIGDTITFVFDRSLRVVTHRVVEIDTVNQRFWTKGDANKNRDGNAVRYKNYLGIVKFSIPKLGTYAKIFEAKNGIFFIIAAGAFIVFLLIVPEIFKSDPKKSEESSADDEKTKAETTPV